MLAELLLKRRFELAPIQLYRNRCIVDDWQTLYCALFARRCVLVWLTRSRIASQSQHNSTWRTIVSYLCFRGICHFMALSVIWFRTTFATVCDVCGPVASPSPRGYNFFRIRSAAGISSFISANFISFHFDTFGSIRMLFVRNGFWIVSIVSAIDVIILTDYRLYLWKKTHFIRKSNRNTQTNFLTKFCVLFWLSLLWFDYLFIHMWKCESSVSNVHDFYINWISIA